MKTFKFRIFKNVYFEKGEEKEFHYHVEEKCKFLGFEFWRSFKRESFGGMEKIQFETEKAALDYIRNYVDNKTVEGWDKVIVNELYCFPNEKK